MNARQYRESTREEWTNQAFIYPATLSIKSGTPRIVEVGPGRGDFLFHLAENNPRATVIGIEIKRKRVDKIIRRIERRELSNVIIIQDDARNTLPREFPSGSVDEIHINFPDPWPKNRHTKNRAISHSFLSECAKSLKTGGILSFISDHERYAKDVLDDLSSIESLKRIESDDSPFPTFFLMKWKEMGRNFYSYKFRKTN